MTDTVVVALLGTLNGVIIVGGAIIGKLLEKRLTKQDETLTTLHTKLEKVGKDVNGASLALLAVTREERFAAGEKHEKERQDTEEEHSG